MRSMRRLWQKCGHQISIYRCHAGSVRKAGRASQVGCTSRLKRRDSTQWIWLSLFFIVVVRLSLPVSMPLRQVGQTLRKLLLIHLRMSRRLQNLSTSWQMLLMRRRTAHHRTSLQSILMSK